MPQAQERIREAEKLGFQRMILPLHNLMRLEKEAAKTKAELVGIRNIRELYGLLSGSEASGT